MIQFYYSIRATNEMVLDHANQQSNKPGEGADRYVGGAYAETRAASLPWESREVTESQPPTCFWSMV